MFSSLCGDSIYMILNGEPVYPEENPTNFKNPFSNLIDISTSGNKNTKIF